MSSIEDNIGTYGSKLDGISTSLECQLDDLKNHFNSRIRATENRTFELEEYPKAHGGGESSSDLSDRQIRER